MASSRTGIQAYLNCHQRDWVSDQEKVFGSETNFSWKKIEDLFLPFFDNSLDRLTQVFLADYNGKLRYNFSYVNSLLKFKVK